MYYIQNNKKKKKKSKYKAKKTLKIAKKNSNKILIKFFLQILEKNK